MNQGEGVFFSERFEVAPEVLREYGAFDISVEQDMPLFIDPFLLFSSANPTYQALHGQIIEYLRFLQSRADGGLDPKLVANWYQFKEVKQNWLGFSQGGNSGHGLGRGFATSLHATLGKVLDYAAHPVTESSHLEKVALIQPGVGRDSISDFTTNLVKHHLLTYTQTFAAKYIDPSLCATFRVPRVAFDYTTETWATRAYTLPVVDGDYVLLTPMDLLTRDDTWINRSDMIHKFDLLPLAVEDGQQRALINNYFRKQLGEQPSQQDTAAARVRTLAAFPELVDLYIKLKEDDREQAVTVSAQKTLETHQALVDQVKAAVEDLEAKTDIFGTPWSSLQEAQASVVTFKNYVEHQDGYRLINQGGGKPFTSEAGVQTFFGLVLQGSRFDINREPNNGRGPVDFKVSAGAHDKTLIEFKLAKSTSLKRNLQNQVSIYEAANGTQQSIKVIICYTAADQARVAQILADLRLSTEASIVLIDARSDNKPSASKA